MFTLHLKYTYYNFTQGLIGFLDHLPLPVKRLVYVGNVFFWLFYLSENVPVRSGILTSIK